MHAEDYDESFVWKCRFHALAFGHLPYCLWLSNYLIVHSSLGSVLLGFKKYPEILALCSKADRLRIRDMFPTCLSPSIANMECPVSPVLLKPLLSHAYY